MPKSRKSLQQQIMDAKYKIIELETAYITQLYLETMAEVHDYKYRYDYGISNQSVPNIYHHPDFWLKAIIKHMGMRERRYGGAKTLAEVVTVPDGFTEKQIDVWLAYVTDKLKKKALAHKKRNKNVTTTSR